MAHAGCCPAFLGSLEVVVATGLLRRRCRWGSREGIDFMKLLCLPHNSPHDCKEKSLHMHFREVISVHLHKVTVEPMPSMVSGPQFERFV